MFLYFLALFSYKDKNNEQNRGIKIKNMSILQYKLIDVTGSSKNDITILQRTRGRIEEKETKNCTVLYSL